MTGAQFLALLAVHYRARSDDVVVSIGTWHQLPGVPDKTLYADIAVTVGQIRAWAKGDDA